MVTKAIRVNSARAARVALVLAALVVASCVYTGPEPVPPPLPAPAPTISPLQLPPILMTVLGHPFVLAPGSQVALQVQLRERGTWRPLPSAHVEATLGAEGKGRKVFEGTGDPMGLAEIRFQVPERAEAPEQVLDVTATTEIGTARYSQAVYVGRVYNVMLSTDKPVYQPGQVVHMRALALDTIALKAARDEKLLLTIQDPQGNRVMHREMSTSSWGVAATDFALDSRAANGSYIIIAQTGPVTSTRTIEVKPYTLPRFKVSFHAGRGYYLPGQVVTGTVEARYFFGKPVSGGQVRMAGFVSDVERTQVVEVTGQTGANGVYTYALTLPSTLVAQQDANTAPLDLEITVIDSADHAETVSDSVTVARQPLIVDAVPESGSLRAGVENVVYLQASYPDGKPAVVQMAVRIGDGERRTVTTDPYGLATIRVQPASQRDTVLVIEASDGQGAQVRETVTFPASGASSAVLLRPDKTVYRIGETLNVDAFVAGQARTVYLDIVKDGQTFGLSALPVADGVARASVDVDGSLLGTLELQAYVLTDRGEIIRDRRLVLVEPAAAQVDVHADAQVYRPGDTAHISFDVSRDGKPMPSSLGISIVDESVFSVGSQDPGFARTYFLIERELLQPRYEIHGFTPLGSESSPYDREHPPVRSSSSAPDRVSAREVALAGAFATELAKDDVDAGQARLHQAWLARQTAAASASSPYAERRAYAWPVGPMLFMPLAGVTLATAGRRRRAVAAGLLVLTLVGLAALGCMSPLPPAPAPAAAPAPTSAPAAAAPTQAPAAEPLYEAKSAATPAAAESKQPPRLRQFFPETLYWMPEVETDAEGRASIDVPIADSITSWRLSVLASDADGNLGSAQADLRVFQDFFVEPDLPRFLTQGDEVSVPVSVYNYLDQPQAIRLRLAPASWFEAAGQTDTTLQIGAGEVAAAYVPIRVTGFGTGDFQITATGSQMSDAVQRQVEIVPDGQPSTSARSGSLRAEQTFPVDLPPASIPGTGRVTVKFYPGAVSQMLGGLEGLLRQPNGCFEQTSSTTYPNVMVLSYLKATGQESPQVQMQAEALINTGYQRLLTFEVGGTPGGFSLFGQAPAQAMLTAYGLMELSDMSKVSYVDPALVKRTAGFLLNRQRSDGSWAAEGKTVESGLEGIGDELATAYVTWSLAEAGYGQSASVQRAVAYLHSRVFSYTDPYAQTMVANALLAANPQDPAGLQLLDGLAESAEKGEDGRVSWRSSVTTYLGSQGDATSLEATALAAIAMLKSGAHLDLAQAALDALAARRDAGGGFYTTQATILALKALTLGATGQGEDAEATVRVALSDGRTKTIHVAKGTPGLVQQVSFEDLRTDRAYNLSLAQEGGRPLQYQAVVESYVPWAAASRQAARAGSLQVDVQYDRTELAVNDTVRALATVQLLAQGQAGMVLVDLGVPPGFSPVTKDLDALVENRSVSRYELTGRQVLFYLTDVPGGVPLQLAYRLQARVPLKAQVPARSSISTPPSGGTCSRRSASS